MNILYTYMYVLVVFYYLVYISIDMKIVCTIPVPLYLCINNNYQKTEHVKTVFPVPRVWCCRSCFRVLVG